MNKLLGTIQQVKESGSLSLVRLDCSSISIQVIIIDNSNSVDYLNIGNTINVLFKETELFISTSDCPHISIPNKIPGTINSISRGEVLSKIEITSKVGRLISIVPSGRLEVMRLNKGDSIFAFIKSNEIILAN